LELVDLGFHVCTSRRDMPRRYPPEFRRKVLDLPKAGRTVADLAADLGVSDQTIYNWRTRT